ncbi:N-acetylglucosaminyltransferase [Xylographa opegraphella]|nr:N-acetylglucosaminyltransferase [Xylographa opegraphella]
MKATARGHGQRESYLQDVPMIHDLYDSDEEVPPSSPKAQFFHLRHSPRSCYRQLRRSRPLLIVVLAIVAIFYYSTHYHRRFFPPTHAPSLRYKNVQWRLFAYSQYVTDSHYLCNSVMVFEALSRLGSKADRILMYPEEWDTDIANITDRDSQLLQKARYHYGAKLLPIKVKKFAHNPSETVEGGMCFRSYFLRAVLQHRLTDFLNTDSLTWDASATKFLTFNQTQYLRIIHLDSDVTVQQHMDDLFLLPSARVAMMRAYWNLPSVKRLTSMFILLEPSSAEADRLMAAAESKTRQHNDFDMEILNDLYGDSAMVLPHRNYGLVSGEFRSEDHHRYLGNSYEKWDPKRALSEASLVHFSDWPIPKPWIMWPRNLLKEKMPLCDINPGTKAEAGCENRDIWLGLYNDFRRRRADICALLSVPAPEWPPRRKMNSSVSGIA